MAFLLMFILIVIVLERYSSRTDYKEIIRKRQKFKPGDNSEGANFFTMDQIFKKT